MTGVKDWNFPAFFDAEKTLVSMGYQVVNPAHNNGDTLELALEDAGSPESPKRDWLYYIRRDLPQLLHCDVICLLPNWEISRGATLEFQVAKGIGLPIYKLVNGELVNYGKEEEQSKSEPARV
jgi:hypothetical protein